MESYSSWGNFPKTQASTVLKPLWLTSDIHQLFQKTSTTVLPYGYGRSYGDSCLNDEASLIVTQALNRFIHFDSQTGLLRCESGVSFEDILSTFCQRGWFLPVTPGTKFISVGGAIANDIHGKNHHVAGTFGCHVKQLALLRSNGETLICSPLQNPELFKATIGGLGLTGLILWADIQLKPIDNEFIDMQTIKFKNLDEFFELSYQSDKDFNYIVSWVDCLATGKNLGRGLFMRGNHAKIVNEKLPTLKNKKKKTVPFFFPGFVLNALTVKAFNETYFNKQLRHKNNAIVHYDPFFYPLDSINHWNRIYGRRGFMQYQCVVPKLCEQKVIKLIFEKIADAGKGSFLSVLKTFGSIASPGILSFPQEGTTLALDFSNDNETTFQLLNELDSIVVSNDGRVYPAKDARMSSYSFKKFFPRYKEFAQWIDPQFSSSFWRRVQDES